MKVILTLFVLIISFFNFEAETRYKTGVEELKIQDVIIGVLPHERVEPQHLVIDLLVLHDLSDDVAYNRLAALEKFSKIEEATLHISTSDSAEVVHLHSTRGTQ